MMRWIYSIQNKFIGKSNVFYYILYYLTNLNASMICVWGLGSFKQPDLVIAEMREIPVVSCRTLPWRLESRSSQL